MNSVRYGLNTLIALALVAGGAWSVKWMVDSRPEALRHSGGPVATRVRAEAAAVRTFDVPVIGHGTVRPHKQIKIVPQVSGEITFAHEDLAEGKIIEEGHVLFEIDPSPYQSRVASAEADVNRLDAMLDKLDAEQEVLDQRIEVADRILTIAKNEFEKSETLLRENVGTGSIARADEQKYLQQRQVVLEMEGTRKTLPHTLAATRAQLASAQAHLDQARHDLERTTIRCPFRARVESVSALASQVVTRALPIATLTDVEAFEVSTVVDPRDLKWIHPAVRDFAEGQAQTAPEVVVSWTLYGQKFQWNGRVTRFARMDEATRMAHLVVELRDVQLGFGLDQDEGSAPLSIGMFCRTEIPTRPLNDALVVPRHAIYDNRYVYVFEPASADSTEGRGTLGIREVPILRAVGDEVLVRYADAKDAEACTLAAGERVIVSPLLSPVVGMDLQLRDDRLAWIPGDDSDDATGDPKPRNVTGHLTTTLAAVIAGAE